MEATCPQGPKSRGHFREKGRLQHLGHSGPLRRDSGDVCHLRKNIRGRWQPWPSHSRVLRERKGTAVDNQGRQTVRFRSDGSKTFLPEGEGRMERDWRAGKVLAQGRSQGVREQCL